MSNDNTPFLCLNENVIKTDLYILEVYGVNINGYDTFRTEFMKCIKPYGAFKLHVIVEDSPVKCIVKEYKDDIEYIYLPEIKQSRFRALEIYMKEAVLRSKRMIFLSNFFPVIFNVKIVRKLFPRAKFVHVIHDFPWLTVFGGNEKAYMNFIEHIDWEEQTGNDDKFVKYCTYDILESFGLSDVIICLCRSTYYMLKDFYGIDVRKIRLIQNGMEDYATFPQYSERLKIMRKYNIPESGLNALLVGRLTFSKGADRIANMLKLINQNESLNLVYAGDDNVLEWLSKDVSCNEIQVGFVSHEDLCALYSVIISFKA